MVLKVVNAIPIDETGFELKKDCDFLWILEQYLKFLKEFLLLFIQRINPNFLLNSFAVDIFVADPFAFLFQSRFRLRLWWLFLFGRVFLRLWLLITLLPLTWFRLF